MKKKLKPKNKTKKKENNRLIWIYSFRYNYKDMLIGMWVNFCSVPKWKESTMNKIIGELGKNPKFVSLVKNIENTKSPIEISDLTHVAKTSNVARTNDCTKRPIYLVP